MTRICLSGSMRAAVTDETAQGGTLTAFVASVPSIIGFWYAGFDIQLSPRGVARNFGKGGLKGTRAKRARNF